MTKAVKEKKRLKKPGDMTPEERASYGKLSPAQKALYDANLAAQEAQDRVATAKAEAETARETAKRNRAIASGERKLTAAVRSGEVKLEEVLSLIAAFGISDTGATVYKTDGLNKPPVSLNITAGEASEIYKRIEEAAKKPPTAARTPTAKIVAPSFTLSHSLAMVTKGALLPPEDGARPDATLIALIRRFGFIEPLLVKQVEAGLKILDGKRRYHLIGDAESVPVVIVSGFPDEYTEEAAEIAINRGRSLNAIRAGEVITRARTRGKTDPEIRRDMGFKTGEVDKYARALALPEPLPGLLRTGLMTPATALTLAKASASVRDEVIRGYNERKAKETPEARARISEADVETAKSAAAKGAISRDAASLTGLANGVTAEDATGGKGGTQSADAPPAHPSPVSDAGTGQSEKALDNGSAETDNAPAWLETAFERLGEVAASIPQDAPAPVLETYRALLGVMVELAGETEYATIPDEQPPAMFKAPKKAAVENTVEARPGWKASVLARFKPLMDSIAAESIAIETANAFRAEVSAAR